MVAYGILSMAIAIVQKIGLWTSTVDSVSSLYCFKKYKRGSILYSLSYLQLMQFSQRCFYIHQLLGLK